SVLDDWATEVAAVVVVVQLRLRLAGAVQEEVVGVKRIVSEKLERGAVKIIAAALRDQVDHRALRLAKLCTEAVALNTKLLNRVDRRKHEQRAVRTDVHVVDAVNRPQIRVGLVAVDRHVDARVESGSTRRKSAPR